MPTLKACSCRCPSTMPPTSRSRRPCASAPRKRPAVVVQLLRRQVPRLCRQLTSQRHQPHLRLRSRLIRRRRHRREPLACRASAADVRRWQAHRGCGADAGAAHARHGAVATSSNGRGNSSVATKVARMSGAVWCCSYARMAHVHTTWFTRLFVVRMHNAPCFCESSGTPLVHTSSAVLLLCRRQR